MTLFRPSLSFNCLFLRFKSSLGSKHYQNEFINLGYSIKRPCSVKRNFHIRLSLFGCTSKNA